MTPDMVIEHYPFLRIGWFDFFRTVCYHHRQSEWRVRAWGQVR